MSKADDGLRALIQKHLPRPTGFVFTPMETGGTHSGVPDLHWGHKLLKMSGWLECKATTGWAVEVRPHQCSWIRSHLSCGVRIAIPVRARGQGSARGEGDALWLLKGDGIEELQENGLKLPEEYILGRWYGEPRTWDWSRVAELLTMRV